MEEIREEKIAQILSQLQSFIRGHMSRLTYKKLQSQKVTIMLIINLQYVYIPRSTKFRQYQTNIHILACVVLHPTYRKKLHDRQDLAMVAIMVSGEAQSSKLQVCRN